MVGRVRSGRGKSEYAEKTWARTGSGTDSILERVPERGLSFLLGAADMALGPGVAEEAVKRRQAEAAGG